MEFERRQLSKRNAWAYKLRDFLDELSLTPQND
jgi:hypothetical protein